ncbi:MAG: DUF389 domain-containing protein [Oryzihumus sp.]
MLLNLRLAVPPGLTTQVRDLLESDERVTNLVVLPGAAVEPAGDAVLADVPREAAGELLGRLDAMGLGRQGAMSVSEVTASPYRRAREAEAAAPGSPDDGVVWRMVEERAWSDSRGSVSFYAFLTLATALAAIAVITDSSILVVGAMVVGPEFGPVAAIATGIVLRQWGLVPRSLSLLARSFCFAVLVVAALALVARGLGWIDPSTVTRPRPLTGFIWHPDHWSFVVALLAGFAGVLSLTSGKSSALVGVFISVTTVPAAGNLALALALWQVEEMRGSALQLAVNLTGMVIAGVITLVALRVGWRVVQRRTGGEVVRAR